MSTFLGMDTEQVRSHADRLRTAGGAVADIRAQLHLCIRSVTWSGPDAEEFRGHWEHLATDRLTVLCGELATLSDRTVAEAEQQELASGTDGGSDPDGSHGPSVTDDGSRDGSGYLDRDHPWIPGWLEDPVERTGSDLAALVSEGIGWSVDTGLDGIVWAADRLGLETDGVELVRGDVSHLGGLMEDWATGERVPTLAELASSTLLAGGSTAVAPIELFTDSGFLDPRTDVTVHDINEVHSPSTPKDLADLVHANDEARGEMFGRTDGNEFTGLRSGQIRIQTVQMADGGHGYIVHAPPTGGGGIGDLSAWGAQGNSAGWDSNLRAMAGQESAAMADIRAAMNAPGPDGHPLVPPGSEVMFVGHSQGGLSAAQLSADPSFNNASGAPGSYDVTHSFSVGSPVETVVPAQGSTQVVNVAHNPVWEPTSQVPGLPSPGRHPVHIADPVPRLDLDGYRVDGSRVSSPNVREAWIDAPSQTHGERSQLPNAHDSVLDTSHGPDPTGGYYGSVRHHTDSHPVLSELQADVEGRYVGSGVTMIADQVVEVGREDLG